MKLTNRLNEIQNLKGKKKKFQLYYQILFDNTIEISSWTDIYKKRKVISLVKVECIENVNAKNWIVEIVGKKL